MGRSARTRHSNGHRGERQHYVPASFIARFSSQQTGQTRKRRLWVRESGAERAYSKPARKLAYEIGLYDVENDSMGSKKTLDIAWNYETSLPAALDALTNRQPLDGLLWASTLVPFVAGLFVRGPDYPAQYAQRFPISPETLVQGLSVADNATAGRLINLQELLAPTMASKWSVVHFPAGTELITSDTSFALMGPAAHWPAITGYVIPISRTATLVVSPQVRRTVLEWTDGRWVVPLVHIDGLLNEIAGLKRAIGAFALHQVYGPTPESVDDVAAVLGAAPTQGAGVAGSMIEADFRCHFYDYFRVLSILRKAPEGALDAACHIDWSSLARSWTAPVAVELCDPGMTAGGIRCANERVSLDLQPGVEYRLSRLASKSSRYECASTYDLRTEADTIAQLVPGSRT